MMGREMYATYDALCELSDEFLDLADRAAWRWRVLRMMGRAVWNCDTWRNRYHAARLCALILRCNRQTLELFLRYAEAHIDD